MQRFVGAACATFIVCFSIGAARGDDPATAILDKAIQAMGGEDKLAKAEVISWKTQGRMFSNGNETGFSSQVTIKGLDQLRREFGNDQFKLLVVIDGDRGWRRLRDENMKIVGDGLTNEKRSIYLQVVPIRLVPLRGKGFKYEAAPDEKVGDRPAAVLKATGPDGKSFALYFDKESGLPVKEVARMSDPQGKEYAIEVTFAAYKDFDGIKKATQTEVKRDGKVLQKLEMTEFKVLDKVDPSTFSEPK
jgi:hypothetical protein